MDIVDFIISYEADGYTVKDEKDLLQVIDFCQTLAQSQGKYGRLVNELQALLNDKGTVYPFVI